MDKTHSEAKLKVDAVDSGAGFEAFQNLYLWYSGSSGEAISWKTGKVMNPTPVKKEEDLAAAIDQWHKDVKILEAHGGQFKLPASFKIQALKGS